MTLHLNPTPSFLPFSQEFNLLGQQEQWHLTSSRSEVRNEGSRASMEFMHGGEFLLFSVLCFCGCCVLGLSLYWFHLTLTETHSQSSAMSCPHWLIKGPGVFGALLLSPYRVPASYLEEPVDSRQRRHCAPVSSTPIWRNWSSLGIYRLK